MLEAAVQEALAVVHLGVKVAGSKREGQAEGKVRRPDCRARLRGRRRHAPTLPWQHLSCASQAALLSLPLTSVPPRVRDPTMPRPSSSCPQGFPRLRALNPQSPLPARLAACLLVEAHNGGDPLAPEVVPVVLGRVQAVARHLVAAHGGARERNELAGQDPVEVAVLNLGAWTGGEEEWGGRRGAGRRLGGQQAQWEGELS